MSTTRPATPDRAEVASYYDETLRKRLNDYVHGNLRIDLAVALATSAFDRSTTRVLDIGCGLGIAAARFREGRPWLNVHAVDISPKSIEAAGRLFGEEGLVFEVSDLSDVPRLAPYDVVTMLDVYEHIPRDVLPRFNAVINACLAPGGKVVVTTPTPMYQDYLAAHNPGALQIIDESVRLEDLDALARDLGGIVTYYNLVDVWNTKDYAHCIINRNKDCSPRAGATPTGWARVAAGLRNRRDALAARYAAGSRRARVKARLGVDI